VIAANIARGARWSASLRPVVALPLPGIWQRDGSTERTPTKAGIACNVGLLPKLIASLQKAELQARDRGLL
jgi:hypothetical protein